jgi:hypothetical protein
MNEEQIRKLIERLKEPYFAWIDALTRPKDPNAWRPAATFTESQAEDLKAGYSDGVAAGVRAVVDLYIGAPR